MIDHDNHYVHMLECIALWVTYFTLYGIGIYYLLAYLGVL